MPARSPMPLIAHSTWRAPAWTPANELATASPRSSWQWTDSTDVAQVRDQLVQLGEEGGVLVRHRVADGVRDVDRRRALVDRDLDDLGGELHVRAAWRPSARTRRPRRAPSPGRPTRGRGPSRPRAWTAAGTRCGCRTSRRTCGSEVARVLDGLPCTIDVRRVRAGEAGDDRSLDLARDRLDRLEVARRGDREAGFDDVDVQPRELVGDLELLGRVERDARRLLPSRSVVSKICTWSMSSPVLARSLR